MNNPRFVLKLKDHRKKAISPVIATIILIAVALIMALVVGVFAFGLFSTHANAVSFGGGALIATTGVLQFSLSNPGSSATTISSLTLSGSFQGTTIAADTASCTGGTPALTTVGAVAAGTSTAFNPTCKATTGPFIAGNNYNYVLTLANGQTISGSIVAQ